MIGAHMCRVGKTARPWKTTAAGNVALTVVKPGQTLLDYGAGPYQRMRPQFEAKGVVYTAYDCCGGIGFLEMLNVKYDVVLVSNVLNTAVYADNPRRAYNIMLREICAAVADGGCLVANIPSSGPKSEWMTPTKLGEGLRRRFRVVVRLGSVCVARELR